VLQGEVEDSAASEDSRIEDMGKSLKSGSLHDDQMKEGSMGQMVMVKCQPMSEKGNGRRRKSDGTSE
jgi:hypothetical protein